MTIDTIAGITVELDKEGFLAVPAQWTEEMAEELARREGVDPLTERHWEVIRFMRQHYEETGSGPNVRMLAKTSGIPIKELYQLFPKGPAKTAAKLAGIPKPRGCI
jgi:tRNA 2-thiouridine synthesizing protein E